MAESSAAIYPLSQSHGNGQKKCIHPKVRMIGSKGAALVIVWAYLVSTSFSFFIYSSNFFHLPHASHDLKVIITSVYGAIATLCAPLLGLIASAYFSTYKMICVSIWLMWCGVISAGTVSVLLDLFDELPWALTLSGLVIAEIIFLLGFVAFAVNSVSFGLDQMPDASSEQITAFIHWYVWTLLAAIATAMLLHAIPHCTSFTGSVKNILIAWLVSGILQTLVLCSVFLLPRWMIIEPESTNPIKTILKVLRFAAKHKVPVRRSAFTYWEPGVPPRIDLGKSKYGGPFTNEEVEDVKTFLRMLVVLSCSSVTLCSTVACRKSIHTAVSTMFSSQLHSCPDYTSTIAVSLFLSILASLPVYDLFIYPVIKKCIPSILKRAGLAQAFMVCGSLIFLVTSVNWYKSTNPDPCFFSSSSNFSKLSVDHRWVTEPYRLLSLAYLFFFYAAMLEFVCAQAPYNLRGLLTGLLQSIMLLGTLLGGGIEGLWKFSYHGNTDDSLCGIWFYLFTSITAILGCVIWCVVAKWYKKREREEVDMCRIFAENYYDH